MRKLEQKCKQGFYTPGSSNPFISLKGPPKSVPQCNNCFGALTRLLIVAGPSAPNNKYPRGVFCYIVFVSPSSALMDELDTSGSFFFLAMVVGVVLSSVVVLNLIPRAQQKAEE